LLSRKKDGSKWAEHITLSLVILLRFKEFFKTNLFHLSLTGGTWTGNLVKKIKI